VSNFLIGECLSDRPSSEPANVASKALILGWLQLLAECLDQLALGGERTNELKTVQETHAMPDYGSHYEDLGNVGDGELESNHFSRDQLAGDDGTQSCFRNFEAATVNADVSVLPQYLHNNRYLRAKSCETSGGRLVHGSNLKEPTSRIMDCVRV
jgi:hypothetical protein